MIFPKLLIMEKVIFIGMKKEIVLIYGRKFYVKLMNVKNQNVEGVLVFQIIPKIL